ncbi:MAG: hypothetical protein ACI9BG_001315, partial [Parasphingorhabdus sp.]
MEQEVISKNGNAIGNIQSPRVTLEDGEKFKVVLRCTQVI